MKPKIFTLFIALTLSAGVLFASDTAVGGIYYDFDATNLTATVTYCGSSYNSYTDEYTGDVVIPATVTYGGNTYSVTSIGDYAFRGCNGLTSVTIPNSVTSIGKYAFSDCSGLTSVTIPNSVTSIGWCVFWGCSGLTSVTIPNSVTSIGDYAFRGCSGLTSVTIPNSVTSIGDLAFYECSGLTSVTIPNSVTSIGYEAFYNCSGLTSVTIPNSVTSIDGSAFEYCSGLISVVWEAKNCADFRFSYHDAPFDAIASQITSFTFGSEVEHIPACLCCGMENLTSVTIPNSVTSIGEYAFSGCNGLTSVTIPNSVTSIGESAFRGCSGLTSVTIPNSVTSIGDGAFYECSGLTSVTIPNSVTSIGDYTFEGCSGLTSVTIPNSVTSIGYRAFYGCSGLTSVTIGNSVTSIDGSAFEYCSGLISVVWEAKNCADFSSSSNTPFYNKASQITSFTFGSEVEHIPAYLCYGMKNLTSITIPNSVTSIGGDAFWNCSGLTSVTIGNSVTSIGDFAFKDCSGLTKTNYTGDIAGWCGINFGNYSANPTAYSHNLYINGVEVKDLVIPNGVTSIGSYAFDGCSGLTSVTIPNSVTSIGRSAFYGCSGLTSVTIGNSVTSIGDEAFSGCTKLINIVCYAAEPPSCDALSVFANYNAYLKVPCSSLDAYKADAVWGDFNNISCIGNEEVQVTEFSVTPSTNDALFTWPAEPNAATYELVISKDGVVFCTLTFNASGQLMGIAFAPGAGTAATTATSGFQFTVTGLDEASHYTYTFDAKDAGGSVVKHYTGEFNTDGFVGLGQIELSGLYTQAGRIVCEGEFRIYNLLGRDVTRLNGSLQGVYVVKTANAAQKVVVK